MSNILNCDILYWITTIFINPFRFNMTYQYDKMTTQENKPKRKFPQNPRLIVTCPKCKKKLVTQSVKYFRHCGEIQKTQENIFEQPVIKLSSENVKTEITKDTKSEIETEPEEVEIEEFEEAEEVKEKVTEQKENFKCPNCDYPVGKFEDCKNPECLTEIVWSE